MNKKTLLLFLSILGALFFNPLINSHARAQGQDSEITEVSQGNESNSTESTQEGTSATPGSTSEEPSNTDESEEKPSETITEPSDEQPSETTDGSTEPTDEQPSETTTDEQPSEATTEPTDEQSPEATTEPTGEQSASGIDYSALQAALDRSDWQAADRETYLLMLAIAGEQSKQQGRFDLGEWQQALAEKCSAFQMIDDLWQQANGNLGFSAQRRIFEAALEDAAVFYNRIGWYDWSGSWNVQWDYTPEAGVTYLQGKAPQFTDPPAGHLPAMMAWNEENAVDRRFQMINACNIGSEAESQ